MVIKMLRTHPGWLLPHGEAMRSFEPLAEESPRGSFGEARWAWVAGFSKLAFPSNSTASVMRWAEVYGPPNLCNSTITRCLSP